MVDSIANDIVYAASNGRKVPGKQRHLGIVMKSITGSRKVIDILNRFGQCISYSAVEGLETELAFSVADSTQATPSGLYLLPNLRTGLAFDNFDCFVETINGKDTLHDNVGIAYQEETTVGMVGQNVLVTIPSDDNETIPPEEHYAVASSSDPNAELTSIEPSTLQPSLRFSSRLRSAQPESDTHLTEHSTSKSQKKKTARRRRAFEAIESEIEPYRKKPRMASSSNIVALNDERRQFIPSSLRTAKILDHLWIMSLTLDTK